MGLDSLEVEMTSYVLLALLFEPTLPNFGLDYASSIVRWLIQQQNPYGGFASTQVREPHTFGNDGNLTAPLCSSGHRGGPASPG